jgi:HSP20 family protein
MSRLKQEANKVFPALREGRRVLLSRHGAVVAAIEPVSLDRHSRELARFALPSEDETVLNLTARELMQGSPSDYVRRAEEGYPSLVTRANKVYGVLTSSKPAETLRSIDEREDALAHFERQHPDASAEDFAAAAARLGTAETSPVAPGQPFEAPASWDLGHVSARTLVGALQEKVEALEDQGTLVPTPSFAMPSIPGDEWGAAIGSGWVTVAEPFPRTHAGPMALSRSSTPTDAYLRNGYLVVEVDLPGIDPDSIEVGVEGTALTVQAVRKMPSDVSRWVMRERLRGPIMRQIVLNEDMDLHAVEATYEGGILTIAIPAPIAADDSRKIPVQRGALAVLEVQG